MGLVDHTHLQIAKRDRESSKCSDSQLYSKSFSIRGERSTSRPHGGLGGRYMSSADRWRQHEKEAERRGRWQNGPWQIRLPKRCSKSWQHSHERSFHKGQWRPTCHRIRQYIRLYIALLTVDCKMWELKWHQRMERNWKNCSQGYGTQD